MTAPQEQAQDAATAPLRIVHAVRSDRFAGVEQFVRRLAIAQAEAGHSVHVIGGDPAHMSATLAAAGVGFEPGLRVAAIASTLRRRASFTDVVNTHMTAADVAAALAFSGRGRPAVVSTRHFAQRRGRYRALPLDLLVQPVIDAEISVSTTVAAVIQVPSTVVHPGIQPRERTPINARRRVVLVAQRLQPEKQTLLAVKAFSRSGLAAEGWRLNIAGTGPEADDIAQQSAPLGDAVHLLGFRDDVPELMATASILLATSPFEHFGLSVLEAMSCGLPVLASASGGHLETIGGLDERALFTPGDADAAARALHNLASDPAGREWLSVAEQARVVRDFSPATQVERTSTVYQQAIGGREPEGHA